MSIEVRSLGVIALLILELMVIITERIKLDNHKEKQGIQA